ncbi:MAG: NTP transferase domain-containing protein [Planctomycetes bacterium]|nr:NTP transferase domain-containing protein [Planctomycetota bacterium]
MNDDIYAVIMAGGSGTRFWPLSRAASPKQLIDIMGGATMIQATVARLQPLVPPDRVLVITTAALAEETRRQLPMVRPEHVVAEPVGRDTAACVALAAVIVERIRPGAVMILLPADHLIQPADAFQRALRSGVALARQGMLATYGIAPRYAASGYGYVKLGAALAPAEGLACNRVECFVEKPDAATAERYLADGSYRWNSGIFTWRSDVVLAELAKHCGWLTEALAPLARAWDTPGFAADLARIYGPLRKISIDYALMEKAQHIAAVTVDFGWDDLGSWDALYDHLDHDAHGVAARGDVQAIECADSLFFAGGKQAIVAIGTTGMIVVSTDDALLILPKGRSQDVKRAVEALKARERTKLL